MIAASYNGSNASGTLLQQYTHHPTEERIVWKKTYAPNGSLTETIIYVGEDFVQIINNSGTYNYTYIHANNQQVAQVLPDGTKQFLLTDNKGSATVTTNSTGGVVERTSYTPYGSVLTGGTGSRFNYEARENDPVAGDTDFRFRKYRPDWGLFTQPDNTTQNVYNPQMLNRYSFEKNNPYRYVDKNGLYAIQIGLGVSGVLGGFGGSLSGGIAFSNDKETGWEISPYITTSGYAGAGIEGGGFFEISHVPNAKRLSDLRGLSGVTGGSIASAFGAGYEYGVAFANTNIYSNTIRFSAGGGGEAHAGLSQTTPLYRIRGGGGGGGYHDDGKGPFKSTSNYGGTGIAVDSHGHLSIGKKK